MKKFCLFIKSDRLHIAIASLFVSVILVLRSFRMQRNAAPVEQHLHLLHSFFLEAIVGECFLSASYVERLFLFDLFSCMIRFLFLRIQDFGQNGGAALQALDPKFELFRKNVNEIFNMNFSLPQDVEVCATTTSFKLHSTL